jgi:outer membrane protein OmpA-like peptidoglycan-associated protein
MKIDERRIGVLALAGGLFAVTAGCGHAGISPQLSGARAVMAEARSGSAQRLEPDEVLAAQRTLNLAEGQEDGSVAEAHYAYLAERETRVAMADARRTMLEQGVAEDQSEYQSELERLAHERGVELDATQDALADRQRVVLQQQRDLAATDAALAVEQQARRDAEANAAAAIERLRLLATVRVEATETIITLSGEVLFESDRAVLRPEARERLTAVAEAMRASPEQFAIVAGYTDSRGSDSHNQQLSQSRADAVRDFLLSAGVPADRLRSEGRGEASPIASNDSAEGRANNRRVEIILRPSTTVATIPATTTVTVVSGTR